MHGYIEDPHGVGIDPSTARLRYVFTGSIVNEIVPCLALGKCGLGLLIDINVNEIVPRLALGKPTRSESQGAWRPSR